MPLIRNSSLQRKLTFVIVCTSLVGLCLACLSFEFYERTNFRSGMTSELSALADILGANTAASLALNDRKSAQDMLAALRAERHVVAAFLYDSRGMVFAEYRREGIGAELAGPPRREDGAQFQKDSLTLYRSVSRRGENTGNIAIVSDLGALQAKIRQYTEISVVVILFSVLVTYLVCSRLLRSITEPILHLAQIAARVTVKEDYALRALPRGDDEVGALIGSFNRMLERIQERDAALKAAKDDLEIRVQARTQELQSEVNERVRAEETLSDERKILRTLIDNVPDFMYVKDTDCRFLVANLSVARQMGAKTPAELLGKNDFDFYSREIAATFCEDEQRVIRSGQAEVNREETGVDSHGK
jgi:PAS domain S-box-containing protein